VPILIGNPQTGSFAAVHSGWRGTYAGIVLYALERLSKEYNAQPADCRVAIGPAAAACCYEVGAEVIDGFKERFPGADLFTPTREGHAHIDLLKANRDQLLAAGISPERIHTAPFCTMMRTDLFFSYRREKQLHGKVGRLMSVIGRTGAKGNS
jgi:YfiH family protein